MALSKQDRAAGLLPSAPVSTLRRVVKGQTAFGGLSDRGDAASDIHEMENLAPASPGDPGSGALTVRRARRLYISSRNTGVPHGVTRHRGEVIFAQGSVLYASEGGQVAREVGAVSDTDKTFVSFGDDLFILPDKLVYRRQAEATSVLVPAVPDTGVIREVTLEGSTMQSETFDFEEAGFAAGDGIQLEILEHWMAGTLNGAYRIRSVSHMTLQIEGSFPGSGSFTLRMTRPMPTLTGICAVGDRLWGCADSRIAACEAGNPYNWCCPIPDAPERNPVTLAVSGDGAFTACISWQGYPTFFMEDRIIRVIGRSSGSFALDDQPAPGVAPDASRTLCEVGGALYYRGHAGVWRYTGAYPERIGGACCDGMSGGCAGTDGRVLYLSATRPDGAVTYLYDPGKGSGGWYREDGTRFTAMSAAVVGAPLLAGPVCLMQDEDGAIWHTRSFDPPLTSGFSETDMYGAMPSYAEFGDERTGEPDGVRLLRVSVRAKGSVGAGLRVLIRRDGESQWQTLGAVAGTGQEQMYHIPVLPRRCDWFRLRLSMTGAWSVSGLWRTLEMGGQ